MGSKAASRVATVLITPPKDPRIVPFVLVPTVSPSTLGPQQRAAARAGVPGVKPVLVELTDFQDEAGGGHAGGGCRAGPH